MSHARLGLVGGLAAIALAACGSVNVHPVAPTGSTTSVSRGQIDNPLTKPQNHLACLHRDHLPVQEVGRTQLVIGSVPAAPTVVFEPTPGVAQGLQIQGIEQGAEVIGSAVLYPNQASDSELGKIETCLAEGVAG